MIATIDLIRMVVIGALANAETSLDAAVRRGSMTSRAVDADALVADLFHREGRSLVRLARLFCDDRDAAEDLVQEAFIRLHRRADTIRDLNRAPAFLRSIVLNLARDHNRRGLMSLRHRGAMVSPEATDGIEDEAIASGEAGVVLDALALLPERQRACLVLRFYLEMSESETADSLGISKSSVKTHCRRGLAALEGLVGEQNPAPADEAVGS